MKAFVICCLMLLLGLNGLAEPIEFSAQLPPAGAQTPAPGVGEARAWVNKLLSLPMYTTGREAVLAAVGRQASPVTITPARAYQGMEVLAYALPAPAAEEAAGEAPPTVFFFMLREKRLVATAMTKLPRGQVCELRFIHKYDEAWTDSDVKFYETKAKQKLLSWEAWLDSVSSRFDELTGLKGKAIRKLFRVRNAELWVQRAPWGGTAYEYTNHDDSRPEKPYFVQGYAYERHTVLMFREGTLRAICNGMEIEPFALPEDGSEDPLKMEAYVLEEKCRPAPAGMR